MMGNLMSDCQEAVYRGFVPVPEDLVRDCAFYHLSFPLK